MATIVINLYTDLTDLTLEVQPIDASGNTLGSPLVGGFVEIGDGAYLWTIPDLPANTVAGKIQNHSDHSFTGTVVNISAPATFPVTVNPADIITVAQYRNWNGENSSDGLDNQRQAWITQASEAIADYCNYSDHNIMAADRVEDLEGDCDPDGTLVLASRPINSIVSISRDPYNNDPLSISPDDVYWRIGQSAIKFKRSSNYYGIWQGIYQVTYNGGFVTAPQSLVLACCLVVQTIEKLSLPARDTVSQKVRDVQQNFNPISWSINDPVFMQAREQLNRYRIPTAL